MDIPNIAQTSGSLTSKNIMKMAIAAIARKGSHFFNRILFGFLFSFIEPLSYTLSAQRLALPAAGGTRLAPETDKTQSYEKCHFSGVNPAVRVHAVLGAFLKLPRSRGNLL